MKFSRLHKSSPHKASSYKSSVERAMDYVNRQSLLGLLFAQAGAVLLHLQRLPLWLVLLAIVVFIWRIQILRGHWSFPNRLIRTGLVVCSVAVMISDYREWYALEPMVALLVVAFLLKLLEVERKRDAVALIFVGFFVTASAFLFDQGIVTTLVGIIVIGSLTACLIVVQGSQRRYLSRRTLRTVSVLLLQSVPLMLLMLLVFPRMGALWSVPLQGSSAVTGVSDSMAPGDFSQLTRSRALAFRVSFENNAVPVPSQRYWRGLVLTHFDGRRWQRQDSSFSNPFSNPSDASVSQPVYELDKQGTNFSYSIVLEATNTTWLYGIPYAHVVNDFVGNSVDKKITRSSTNELLLRQPVTQRIQYAVNSSLNMTVKETPENLRKALLLPRGFNPRTIEKAQQWQRETLSTEAYIDRVLTFYNHSFTYTLSPPRLGKNTADDFLFSTQRGFCEHFSSSFVILMRAAGIPARVVTGYQGGEWNAAGHYLLVRQYDAHAWAEVWLPQRGWLRVDPTAAVAPNRIERGLLETLSANEQDLLDATALPSFAWVNRLALKWDSVNYRWQRWVLAYDKDKQSQWLHRLLGQVTATRMAILLVVPGVIILTLFTVLALRSRRRPPSLTVKLYQRLSKKLQRRGVEVRVGETITAYCERAIQAMPEQKSQLQAVVQQLSLYLYGRKGDIDQSAYREIKHLIDRV